MSSELFKHDPLGEELKLAWLATTEASGVFSTRPPLPQPSERVELFRPEVFRQEAARIGERLIALTLGEEDEAGRDLSFSSRARPVLEPAHGDLYGGSGGICLFLAYLAEVTGRADFRRAALRTLTLLRRQLADEPPEDEPIGAFAGWGGIVYLLTHLAHLWHDRSLLGEALAVVRAGYPRIEHDRHLDVASGAAGCLGSLLVLYESEPSETALAAAIACGNQLLRRSVRTPQGATWLNPHTETRPLVGFSHGSAGMTWALMRLHAATEDGRYQTLAQEALRYETAYFDSAAGGWIDESASAEEVGSQVPSAFFSWCHGAPGIALSRLGFRAAWQPEQAWQVRKAVRATWRHGFGHGHSLCHGDLGNLDVLLEFALSEGDDKGLAEVRRWGLAIALEMAEHGFRTGIPSGSEVAGLLVGLAGMGYEMLRFADPQRVPSVLALAGPAVV
jgi:type 2 lantibiotic biosynthesis protein LanM